MSLNFDVSAIDVDHSVTDLSFTYFIMSDVSSGFLTDPLSSDSSFIVGLGVSHELIGNSITYTPNRHFNGTDHFTYRAMDASGGLSAVTSTVQLIISSVNDVPVIPTNLNISLDEDASINFDLSAIDLEDNVTDLSFRYFIMSNVSSGVLSDPLSSSTSFSVGLGVSHELVGHSITYTPNQHFNGTDQFTYTVMDTDGSLSTVTSTVQLIVSSVNDVPVIPTNLNVFLDEDSSLNFDLSAIDIDHSITDPNFTYFIMSYVSSGFLTDPLSSDSSFIVGTGLSHELIGNSITYTPNQHFNGTDHFTYRAMDTSGGLSAVTSTVQLIISSVNDVPVIPTNLNISLDEDTSVNFDLSAIDLEDNVTDLSFRYFIMSNVSSGVLSDPLSSSTSFSVGLGVSHELVGHSITYTPNQHFNGTDQFTYTVMDTDGSLSTVTSSVQLIVSSVNDVPVIPTNLNVFLDEDHL